MRPGQGDREKNTRGVDGPLPRESVRESCRWERDENISDWFGNQKSENWRRFTDSKDQLSNTVEKNASKFSAAVIWHYEVLSATILFWILMDRAIPMSLRAFPRCLNHIEFSTSIIGSVWFRSMVRRNRFTPNLLLFELILQMTEWFQK